MSEIVHKQSSVDLMRIDSKSHHLWEKLTKGHIEMLKSDLRRGWDTILGPEWRQRAVATLQAINRIHFPYCNRHQ